MKVTFFSVDTYVSGKYVAQPVMNVGSRNIHSETNETNSVMTMASANLGYKTISERVTMATDGCPLSQF